MNQENVIKDEEKNAELLRVINLLQASECWAISTQKNRGPETMRCNRLILRIQLTDNVSRNYVLMKMGTKRTHGF